MPGLSDLSEIRPSDASTFGGKAHGLAKLIAAGARVPPGFAIEAGVREPRAWGGADLSALRSRARALLAEGPVAVRSSAVGEDSGERSFAGLFETVLDVTTADGVVDAVGACIGSGARERVLTYAGASGPLAVGVVVQRLVAARAAGVCFTADPTGGRPGVVVEAVAGAGEKLVSGETNPERWRVRGPDVACEAALGVLSVAEVARISSTAEMLSDALGFELDAEWAIDEAGDLWWLQARPITTLGSAGRYAVERSAPEADDGPVTVWSNWNVRETLPGPLYPLTWTVWRDLITPTVTAQIFGVPKRSALQRHYYALDLVQGRIYINLNALRATPFVGRFLSWFFGALDARAGGTVAELERTRVLRKRRMPGIGILRYIRAFAASAWSFLPFVRALRPRRALESLRRAGEAVKGRRDVAWMSDARLLDELGLLARPECATLRDGLQMETLATGVFLAARRAFRGHPGARRVLASGVEANPTTQISLAVDDLAASASGLREAFLADRPVRELLDELARSKEGVAWLRAFDEFLDRFGHRGPREFDIGAPRWSEEPTMIVELVRAQLRDPPAEGVADRMRRLALERRRAIDEAVRVAPFWRRWWMRRLARQVRLFMPLREAPKHYALHAFTRMRGAALELGSRLRARGILESPNDVFFLRLPELAGLVTAGRGAAGLGEKIERRRARLEEFRRTSAPAFYRSDGVRIVERGGREDVGGPAEGVLRGTGVSPGRASGPVRVLHEPDATLVGEGDVLVMRYADPGWTPLFPRAAAVVMEVGGLMCHAAVVAREIGVPAVFGVANATGVLRDGQTVTVDGDDGLVRLTP